MNPFLWGNFSWRETHWLSISKLAWTSPQTALPWYPNYFAQIFSFIIVLHSLYFIMKTFERDLILIHKSAHVLISSWYDLRDSDRYFQIFWLHTGCKSSEINVVLVHFMCQFVNYLNSKCCSSKLGNFSPSFLAIYHSN